MNRDPIKDPPHQNSVRLEPCKNIAAIQGQRPGRASSPPTTRYLPEFLTPHSTTRIYPQLSVAVAYSFLYVWVLF